MRKTDLPEIDEIVFAVSEAPLGEGAEAQVFKIQLYGTQKTDRHAD